jgi:hypothetical protein
MSSSPAFDRSAAAQSNPSPPSGRRPTPRKRGLLSTYGVGRTCADPTCETTLSRYNDAPLCWHHGELLQAAEHRRRR